MEITVDGGSSWSPSVLPPGWRATSTPSCITVQHCLVGVVSTAPAATAAVVATTNGGTTWSVQPMPPEVAEIKTVACASETTCVGTGYTSAAATATSGLGVIVFTMDDGASWKTASFPNQFVAYDSALACPTSSRCVAVGATSLALPSTDGSSVAAAAVYTVDGGQIWQAATVPPSLARMRAVSCPSATRCVALGNPAPAAGTADLYGPSVATVSNDGGASWSVARPVGTGAAELTGISCPTAQDCWAVGSLTAGDRATIEASRDGGTSWAPVRLPSSLTPAQEATAGASRLNIENLSSVSCAASNACVALGAQAAGSAGEQQVVLRNDDGLGGS